MSGLLGKIIEDWLENHNRGELNGQEVLNNVLISKYILVELLKLQIGAISNVSKDNYAEKLEKIEKYAKEVATNLSSSKE